MLLDAFIFMAAAVLTVPLAKYFGFSAVLGYLAAGLLIGESGLHIIKDAEATLHVAELGVVLLLFLVGLELRPATPMAYAQNQ